MENAIFFSGTHGCGKTTTIKRISEVSALRIFSSSDGDHGNPYIDPFYRQIWRLNKYYLDSLEIFKEQSEKGKSLLLVDRCHFDHEAYTRTFHSVGWLKDTEYSKIEQLRKVYFDDERILPQNMVLFFPPEEWTISRIKERWDAEKKKWNEGDFDYLRKLREHYINIYLRESKDRNILIVNQTDLESRVKLVLEFIENLK